MPVLTSAAWRTSYRHEDGDLVRSFFVPALSCAVQYDRLTGYFSAEALSLAARAYSRGERSVATLRSLAEEHLRARCDSIDYVDLREPVDLDPLPDTLASDERAVLAVAVRIGATRLIDNVVLGEERAPVTA